MIDMIPRDIIDEQVLRCVVGGASLGGAGTMLGLSKSTVGHRVRMMRRKWRLSHAPATIAPAAAPDRTPCARCGVRADVGCAHSPWWAR